MKLKARPPLGFPMKKPMFFSFAYLMICDELASVIIETTSYFKVNVTSISYPNCPLAKTVNFNFLDLTLHK